jgi:hypothetical protein
MTDTERLARVRSLLLLLGCAKRLRRIAEDARDFELANDHGRQIAVLVRRAQKLLALAAHGGADAAG